MKFQKPVAWLGGRDLLANLKYFVLFALSSGKLDLRDWMQPEVFPCQERLGQKCLEEFWKQYQPNPTDGEFWFDYVADSGDGMRATFSLAYLMLGDLAIDDESVVALDTPERRTQYKEREILRRGSLVFVGGDTTYHVADYASLSSRFVNPTKQAIDQYAKQTRDPLPRARPIFGIPGNHDYYDELDGFNRQFRKPITEENHFLDLHGRNLFPQLRIPDFERSQSCSYVALALPFDWWLWGLDCELGRLDLRQQEFFKSIRPNGKAPRKLIVATPEPTTVQGRRSLPNEKTAQAFIDVRLAQPFIYMPGEPRATDEQHLRMSGRTRAKELRKAAGIARHQQKVLGLASFDCRLDISGDIHHYARYWGEPETTDEGERPAHYASIVSGGGGASMSPTHVDVGEVRAHKKFPSPQVSARVVNEALFNPVSVISGGNVWLAGGIIATLLYLTAIISPEHANFIELIFGAPRHDSTVILTGVGDAVNAVYLPLITLLGCVMLVGAIFFASSVFKRLTRTYDLANNFDTNANPPDSPKRLFQDLLSEIRGQGDADVSDGDDEFDEDADDSIIDRKRDSVRVMSAVIFFACIVLSLLIGLDLFLQRTMAFSWGSEYWFADLGLVIASIILLIVTIAFAKRCRKAVEKIRRMAIEANTRHRIRRVYKWLRRFVVGKYIDYFPFWGISLLGFVWLLVGIHNFKYSGYPWEIGQAVIYGLGLGAVLIMLIGSIFYSSCLFAQSYRIRVSFFSYGPVIVYNVLAVLLLGTVVGLVGTLPLRILTLDLAAVVIISGILVGCFALAYYVGNRTESTSYKIAFTAFGLWHGLLQVATPFLVVWLGGFAGLLTTIALIILVANPISRKGLVHIAFKAEPGDGTPQKIARYRVALTATWFVLGVIFLSVPFLLRFYFGAEWVFGLDYRGSSSYLATVIGSVMTFSVGALLSCFWLGWYFAISLLYNGHGNEAGSTARTERYKQFIRMKLTETSLTGYVIGLNSVQKVGDLLKPKLIDRFYLEVPKKPEGKPSGAVKR